MALAKWNKILSLLIILFFGKISFGNVSVIQATEGVNISIDKAANATSQACTLWGDVAFAKNEGSA